MLRVEEEERKVAVEGGGLTPSLLSVTISPRPSSTLHCINLSIQQVCPR